MSAWQSAILNNAGYAIIAVDANWVITRLQSRRRDTARLSRQRGQGPDTPNCSMIRRSWRREPRKMSQEMGREIRPGIELFTIGSQPGESATREWSYIRKDGRSVPVLVRATALKDQYGEVFGSIAIAIDLTDRKRAEETLRVAEETLRASEVRFRSAFETAAQGMTLVSLGRGASSRSTTRFARWSAIRISNCWPSISRASPTMTICRPISAMSATCSRDAPDSYQMEKRYIHKSGRIIWVLLSVSIVRSAAGEPIEFVAQILDITEMHEAETVLIEARRAAEAADRAKSEFLANMSHEIRTPMNAILGLSHIVGQTSLSAEQRDYVGKIETAGRSLLGILNDILDYSKIEANRLDLETIDFDLGSVIEDLSVIMSVNGRDKGLELAITPGSRHSPPVARRSVATPASADQLDRQRAEIHQARQRFLAGRAGEARRRRGPGAFWGHRYRHRHDARDAGFAVPTLLSGRRHHHAAFWRNGAWSRHFQASGRADGRRNRRREQARAGEARSGSPSPSARASSRRCPGWRPPISRC